MASLVAALALAWAAALLCAAAAPATAAASAGLGAASPRLAALSLPPTVIRRGLSLGQGTKAGSPAQEPRTEGSTAGARTDGSKAWASSLRRRMQKRDSGSSCAGVTCPDISTCQVLAGGAPACICPGLAPHLDGNKCSVSLAHSDFLDPHNSARAALGLAALVWNETLVAAAQAWAQHLSVNCNNLSHGGLYRPHGERLGQNLASEFGYKGIDNSWPVKAWLAEYQHYTYATVGSSTACVPGQMCGHYTQVVWASSTSVGCAMTTCTWPGSGIGLLWACDYHPAGNVYGDHPFQRATKDAGT